ncbi:hypothetical protein COOONC_25520, partial [Cooperia oncophora]
MTTEAERNRETQAHFIVWRRRSPDDEDSRKKEAVVIPLVKERDWRIAKLLELQKEGKLTEEEQAKLAILTEDQPFEETNGTTSTDAIVVEEESKVVEDADYGAVSAEY